MYEVFGALVGGVLGFIAPYALVAILMVFDKSFGEAGTAFALMMPFTGLCGLFAGIAKGRHRRATGKWDLFRDNNTY